MPVALSAVSVAKRYRGATGLALNGIDLAIPAESITALIGPNGAGKSTLMKAWVGFERPSQGRVGVMGADPWRRGSRTLDLIGYVPQTSALYRDLTIDDHIALVKSLRKAFDPRRAREILGQLSVPGSSRAGRLSGGQQAQVGLALALATNAPVLILDEPLAALDPLSRREFLQVLSEEVRASGRTALMSSHVVPDVAESCDSVIILGAGRILDTGRIDDVVGRYGVVAGRSPGAIGSFMASGGGESSLVQIEHAGSSRASLEETVLGLLASSRRGDPVGRGSASGLPIPESGQSRGVAAGPRGNLPRLFAELSEVGEAEVLRRHPDLTREALSDCYAAAAAALAAESPR